MAGAGQWELVVRNSKKNKTVVNGKLSKDEQKDFIDKALRLNELGQIEKPKVKKEKLSPKKPKIERKVEKWVEPTHSDDGQNEEKKKITKRKNGSRGSSKHPVTLDDAMRKVNVKELGSLLDVVSSRFVDNPLIWLKDLASYLNVRINPSHMPDPVFKGMPDSYPSSSLPASVRKLLMNTISKCNDTVLAAFHKHCITSMVQEQMKGLSVFGYKIFIQILSEHRPHVCVLNLPEYCVLWQSIQAHTPTGLSLLWAVGQCGIDDFNTGLKVWVDLMLPVIGLKNYSSFVVDYGTQVFGRGGGEEFENSSNILGVREFFSILDFTWCNSGSLSKPIQKQLFALYPKVKTTAFSSNPERTLRLFFPSFLRRLDPNVPHLLRVELLTCLVQCLSQDAHCWKLWSHMYGNHLPQSATLLVHIGKEWKVLKKSLKINEKQVETVIAAFKTVNEKMLSKGHAVAGSREAAKATEHFESVLTKVNTVNIPELPSNRSTFTKLLFILLVTVIAWDIKSSGSFHGSKLGKTAEKFGLMPYLEVMGKSLKIGFIQSYKWCVLNIPVYYSRGCELAGPYLLLVLAKLEGVATYIYNGIESGSQFIPVLKTKFETTLPGLSESLIYYGSAAFGTFQSIFSSASEISRPYVLQLQEIMTTRVFVGPLAPENLYQYVVRAFGNVSEIIFKIHRNILTALEDSDHVVSASA